MHESLWNNHLVEGVFLARIDVEDKNLWYATPPSLEGMLENEQLQELKQKKLLQLSSKFFF